MKILFKWWWKYRLAELEQKRAWLKAEYQGLKPSFYASTLANEMGLLTDRIEVLKGKLSTVQEASDVS